MLVEITKQDYLAFSGIDLDIELKGANYDISSNVAELVIQRIHDQFVAYLKHRCGFVGRLKENQKENFKKALLWQIDYIRRNGEMTLDSDNLVSCICDNAMSELKNVGLVNFILG